MVQTNKPTRSLSWTWSHTCQCSVSWIELGELLLGSSGIPLLQLHGWGLIYYIYVFFFRGTNRNAIKHNICMLHKPWPTYGWQHNRECMIIQQHIYESLLNGKSNNCEWGNSSDNLLRGARSLKNESRVPVIFVFLGTSTSNAGPTSEEESVSQSNLNHLQHEL